MTSRKFSKKQTGNTTSNHPDPNECKDLPPSPEMVIKSPMDPNDYLMIQLPNGLKAFLISTIEHQKEVTYGDVNPKTGVFSKVEEFNRKFVKIPDDDDNGIVKKNFNYMDENCNWEPELKKAKLVENPESKSKEECSCSDKFACVSLTVGAGSIHDPTDFKGMAHICEHACSCFGSKKYPQNGLLTKLTQQWEGDDNASTGYISTVYHFHMNLKTAGVEQFLIALDILADSVENPLLTEDKINQEVHSIDSEFNLVQFNDANKCWQLFCSFGDENHPFGSFNFGSYETLANKNLHTKLCEWKKRHYAANYMTVVIKAPLPIEDLDKITRQCFSDIQSSCEPSPMQEILKFYGNPFDTNKFNKLYKFVPTSNLQMAKITWALPAKFSNDFRTKPFVYMYQFFDENSSLVQYLRAKHWCYNVYTYFNYGHDIESFCSLFCFWITLTDSGVIEIFQIIKVIFSYLTMMTSLKANENIFNEIRREYADMFHYGSFVYDVKNTNKLSRDMQVSKKKSKYILTSKNLVIDFNPDILEECIDLLTPWNMNVIICSKTYEDECKEVEKWYKTKYCTCEFDPNFLEACNKVKPYKEFKPPAASHNPFRVKNFIFPVEKLSNQSPPICECLLYNSKASVEYYKQNICSIGCPPCGYSTVSIGSPLINNSELNQILLIVWISMLKDKLNIVLRQAEKARIQSYLYTHEYLIEIILIGSSRGQTKIIQLILETFMKFENLAQQTTYIDFQNSLLESLANTTLNSYVYSNDLTKFILNQKYSLIEQLLTVAHKADFQDFKNMLRDFKDRMFISVFLFGCISTCDAETLTNYIWSMNYRELPEIFHVQSNRAMQLPIGDRCLRVKAKNTLYNTSRVVNHYQLENDCFYEESPSHFIRKFVMILEYAMHLQLRMEEHLSYNTWLLLSHYSGKLGLSIIVAPQPHRHTTGYVDERIDIFLVKFRDEFACYETMFPQSLNTCPALISKEEHNILVQIYDNCLLPSGKNFRKLSVQIVGHRDEFKIGEPLEATCIKNKIEKYASNPSSFGFLETSKDIEYDIPDDFYDENCIKNKIEKYASNPSTFAFLETSNLDIEYDIPDDLYDKNGYFITDIEDFKDSLFVYPCNE